LPLKLYGQHLSDALDGRLIGLQGYTDYINSLPLTTPPAVFGLHENADITKDLQEAQQLLDSLLLTQNSSSTASSSKTSTAAHSSRLSAVGGGGSVAGASAVKTTEEVIADVVADILSRLPPSFDLEAAEAAYPQDYFNSMNTVLVQVGFVTGLSLLPAWRLHGASLAAFLQLTTPTACSLLSAKVSLCSRCL